MKMAIVYWSGSGNTQRMAQAIAEGAQAAAAEASVIYCATFGAEQVAAWDAVLLGCPAMGAEMLEDSEFEPMLDRVEGALVGKKVALFGSYGWGDGEWMRSWESRCADKGIALAAPSLILNEAPDEAGLQQCRALGETMAK